MKGYPTYSGSSGPDAVEHVGSKRHGHDKIFRVANAHYIARFSGREPVRACIHTEFASLDQKSTTVEWLVPFKHTLR